MTVAYRNTAGDAPLASAPRAQLRRTGGDQMSGRRRSLLRADGQMPR
jgi:hypothetical protein